MPDDPDYIIQSFSHIQSIHRVFMTHPKPGHFDPLNVIITLLKQSLNVIKQPSSFSGSRFRFSQ